MVTISRMRRYAPFEPIDPSTCVWGGVPDVINPAYFFEKRPKGFGAMAIPGWGNSRATWREAVTNQ